MISCPAIHPAAAYWASSENKCCDSEGARRASAAKVLGVAVPAASDICFDKHQLSMVHLMHTRSDAFFSCRPLPLPHAESCYTDNGEVCCPGGTKCHYDWSIYEYVCCAEGKCKTCILPHTSWLPGRPHIWELSLAGAPYNAHNCATQSWYALCLFDADKWVENDDTCCSIFPGRLSSVRACLPAARQWHS